MSLTDRQTDRLTNTGIKHSLFKVLAELMIWVLPVPPHPHLRPHGPLTFKSYFFASWQDRNLQTVELYGCVDIACARSVVWHLRDVWRVRDDSRPSQLRMVWRPLFHQARLHVSHVVQQQLSSRHPLCTSTLCSLTRFQWTVCLYVFWSLGPAASVHPVPSS